jgi:hypothetical protein
MNELGELRPSQLIFTFGVGSLVDLPNMSALIMGLDDWDTSYCKEIEEDRLIAAVQKRLGGQMNRLYLPPIKPESRERDPAAPAIGVPVAPFPRWLRCSLCDTMATVESGVFQLKQDLWRPDKTEFVHQGCLKSKGGRPPSAHSARFLLACRDGHLTDFPWLDFVHKGNVPCQPATLSLREFGASGDASDIIVKCHSCNTERRMADAFDADTPFACPGHHPHLRWVEAHGCKEAAKAILLGASNSWFPTALSALSIPRATDKLGKLVAEQWLELKDTEDIDEVRLLRKKLQKFPTLIPLFLEYNDQDIWGAIEAKRSGEQQASGPAEDLKLPEWQVFSAPDTGAENKDFKLKRILPPKGFETVFEDTVLVERIREVRALLGFTRIESNADFAEATLLNDGRLTRICRESPTWLPASEVRGEGIFLRIREKELLAWEKKKAVQQLQQEFFESHKAWRKLRNLEPKDHFPGIRFVLLHSLAHALMRQIVLDCGYTAASIRERLYSRQPGEEGGPMAGILLYTAASDSEGTLGGLVALGDSLSLGRHLQQTLENMRLCASDPLCSEHRPDLLGRGIQGACCHACQFAPETSCERGNRYLDRSVLVNTFTSNAMAFFE